MFTFGRDHEKRCAREYVRNSDQLLLAEKVVDSVHDLLEGKIGKDAAASALKKALTEGGSGVWEQAGSWLIKLAKEDSYFDSIWLELAKHRSANIRFRVASFLSEMKPIIFARLSPLLSADPSARVRLRASPE